MYRHRAQEKSGRGMATDERRSAAIREYQKALVQAKEVETSFKKRALLDSLATVRERVPSARSTYRPPPRPLLSASLPCHVPGRTSRLLARARRAVREDCKDVDKEYDKTEDDLKALQSVGQVGVSACFPARARPEPPPSSPPSLLLRYPRTQIIGEVLRQLDEERYIVKASSGPRYVVGCRNKVDKDALKPTTRVSLDMTTLTIMRILPREVRADFFVS